MFTFEDLLTERSDLKASWVVQPEHRMCVPGGYMLTLFLSPNFINCLLKKKNGLDSSLARCSDVLYVILLFVTMKA